MVKGRKEGEGGRKEGRKNRWNKGGGTMVGRER